MFIPDEKVEEVRAASDIVDVVSEYVQLKKRGSNFFGLCPFHSEKTPSFSVNPAMGIFKCFGCHAGGDVFRFIMQVESVSFPEAVRMLAERAGIPLPVQEEQHEQASEIESIYNALRFAARYYYQQLTQTEAGKPALDYLRRRGFSPKTIKKFGLGYAPDTWDALLRAAEEHHIGPEVLEKAGLVLPRRDGNSYYDRFRGRVMFPILSHVGKVLGFGGRVLTATSDQPKYINSPETKVYNKSRVLYGLFQAKQAIRRAEEVILVEGYTDVMALHQAGVENVVASSGTALTDEQIRMLARYAGRVLLLYDADDAGAGAALRGIDLVLEQGLSAYAVALPAGEDPDSFVKEHGGEAFVSYTRKHRQDFATFRHALARRSGKLDTPEGAAETMHAIVASVARIPDPLMQETFLRRASEVLDVPDMQLREVLRSLHHEKERRMRFEERRRERSDEAAQSDAVDVVEANDVRPADEQPRHEPLPEEKILIRLMLEHGTPMVEFVLSHMALEEFTEGAARSVVGHLLEMYETDQVDARRLFDGSFGGDVQRLASEVMVDLHEPSANWERRQNIPVPRLNEEPYEAAASAMTLLKLDRVNEAISLQKAKIYQAVQEGRDQRSLQAEMMRLIELRKAIERRAFLDWGEH